MSFTQALKRTTTNTNASNEETIQQPIPLNDLNTKQNKEIDCFTTKKKKEEENVKCLSLYFLNQ